MSVIDVDEKCSDLGIKKEDYYEAVKLQGRKIHARMAAGDNSIDSYIDDIKSLPRENMIALIRYDGLYRQYSSIFDFDGPIPGVEAPYPDPGPA